MKRRKNDETVNYEIKMVLIQIVYFFFQTEQIRRVNRLYASDSLFLRDTLKVPVTKEIANSFEVNNHSNSGSTSETLTSSISTDSFTDEEEKSMHDFLGKIDNSIAITRAQVKQVQENSKYVI